MFLDDTLSDEEAVYTEKTGNRGTLSTIYEKNWSGHQSEGTENGGSEHMITEEDSIQNMSSEDSWTCPLTLDEVSSSPSKTETEETSSPRSGHQLSGPATSQVKSNNCSSMILKLRRIMFGEGLNRKKAHYQAVSDSGIMTDACMSNTEDSTGKVSRERNGPDLHMKKSKVAPQWQGAGSFSQALQPLSSSSKEKHRLLSKIKYCPYLSACHSAEHRRQWVLRSAVQRARRAMRFYYPDLVGKRVLHLYEEDDKSEVWYKGEVLRIHEAHANPLKTIFEVRYDSEPEWKYYLELLIDYKKGWLKIED